MVFGVDLNVGRLGERPGGVGLGDVAIVLADVENEIGRCLAAWYLDTNEATASASIDMGGDGRIVDDLEEGPGRRLILLLLTHNYYGVIFAAIAEPVLVFLRVSGDLLLRGHLELDRAAFEHGADATLGLVL